MVAQINTEARLTEYQRAWNQHVRQSPGILPGIRNTLSDGYVARVISKPSELGIRDEMLVHPESAHSLFVDGRFLRIVMVGAHQERAAGYPRHAWERRFPR